MCQYKFFTHSPPSIREGGYFGRDGYQRKLARIRSSTSFSTHAGCARHHACTAASAYIIAFIFFRIVTRRGILPYRGDGGSIAQSNHSSKKYSGRRRADALE